MRPPACSAGARGGSLDPEARMRLQTSISPATPQPSQDYARHRSPRAYLASRLARSNSAPAGSLDRSAGHRSAALLRKPPPPHLENALPALQTAHECTDRADTP